MIETATAVITAEMLIEDQGDDNVETVYDEDISEGGLGIEELKEEHYEISESSEESKEQEV